MKRNAWTKLRFVEKLVTDIYLINRAFKIAYLIMQSLSLREDASSEYAPTSSPPLSTDAKPSAELCRHELCRGAKEEDRRSKGGFRRDCRYQGGRRPSLSLGKGVCREAFSNGRERGIGYCAALRDADPCLATGLPANFSMKPERPLWGCFLCR